MIVTIEFMGDLRDKVNAVDCGCWEELITQFEGVSYAVADSGGDHWIYRGQADTNWWLKPSIELFQESLTATRSMYSIRQLEQQFLYDFQSSASQFLGNLPAEQEALDWLAVLQHYGTPTRLLDWTYSPTVATYFALREKPKNERPDGGRACVWALNVGKLRGLVMGKLGTTDWGEAYKEALSQVRDNRAPAYVTPFLPRNRYSRMSGQQGLFLVKTVAEQPFIRGIAVTTAFPLEERSPPMRCGHTRIRFLLLRRLGGMLRSIPSG
jgi:hypothetical protein